MTQLNGFRRVLLTSAVTIMAVAGTAGCSSSSPSIPATSTAATSATQPAARTVSAGLKKIQATAKAIEAKVSGGTAVSDAKDQVEADWKPVEGVVKAKASATYETIEDAFGELDSAAKAKDTVKTSAAVAKLNTAIEDYLKANP